MGEGEFILRFICNPGEPWTPHVFVRRDGKEFDVSEHELTSGRTIEMYMTIDGPMTGKLVDADGELVIYFGHRVEFVAEG